MEKLSSTRPIGIIYGEKIHVNNRMFAYDQTCLWLWRFGEFLAATILKVPRTKVAFRPLAHLK